ncbi:MAG: glycosyltransferase [Verrucomicrobiae bacterium]|nr:glycosyltransferase [Verrucomicrobiae bacterium]
MRSLAAELGLDGQVAFLGPLFDERKTAAQAHCTGFILPSFSEGLPMGVLEAWACAKPVLMTVQCNLTEGFASGAALEMEASVEGMAETLRVALKMPPDKLREMGENGRRLVIRKFTWPRVAKEMRAVCGWMVQDLGQPQCVSI